MLNHISHNFLNKLSFISNGYLVLYVADNATFILAFMIAYRRYIRIVPPLLYVKYEMNNA